MIRRHHITLFIKAALSLGLLSGVATVVAFDGRDAPGAAADPAYGQVKVAFSGSPLSNVVIEGHYFMLPAAMTTCPDNQVIPSGTATGATATTLIHSGQTWTTNQWAGYDVQITSGTGSPQWRVVASNTNNTLTLTEAWGGIVTSGTTSAASATTLYDPPTNTADSGTATAATATTLTETGNTWTTNAFAGMILEMSSLGSSQKRTIVSNTSNTLTVDTAWTTHVTATATGGSSTTLVDTTKSWTVNQWANKTVQLTGGTGSGQTRKIVSNTSNTLTIEGTWVTPPDATSQYIIRDGPATGTAFQIKYGWIINELAGMTLELPTLGPSQTKTISSNTTDTITVPAWTTHVTQTGTGGTSTTLVDTTGVAWTTNQWANKTVQLTAGTASPQSRKILSNTNNTLTIENTWTTSAGGTATSATTTTLTDASAGWTTNAFTGMQIDILSGPAAGQSRTITSNTATQVTISPAWSPSTPAFGDAYRIVRAPDATTQYIVRDGPAIGTPYQVRQAILPGAGSGYQLFKSACRPGSHDITVTFNDTKFEVATDGGISSGGNTSTTLNDSGQTWKINQWAGSRVNITGGAGLGQSRVIVSNTATQLVVTPAWGAPQPTTGSVYNVGGIQDGGFITSTGRTLSCPAGSQYGTNTASLHCVTLGTPPSGLPQGPTGTGNLVTVAFKAIGRGLIPFTLTTQVLEVDGSTIPADTVNGNRRVIRCPDSGPPNPPPGGDGIINSIDFAVMAQAFGHTPTNPPVGNLYSVKKDPNEDNIVNSIDQGVMAGVFGRRCTQL